MTKRLKEILLLCGIVFTFAAFPVFGQDGPEKFSKDLPNENFSIDQTPLFDFLDKVLDRVEKKEVDPEADFLLEIEGELTKEDKFDPQKTRFVRAEGDEQMIALAENAFEAVNDSGAFFYFSLIKMRKVKMVFAQSGDQIFATASSEMASNQNARTTANVLDLLLISSEARAKDVYAQFLLKSTRVLAEDKNVIIKTAVEKSAGQEIIKRKLTEQRYRRQNKQGE